MKTLLFSFLMCLFLLSTSQGQYVTKYPEIPRIDVHTHLYNNYPAIATYLVLRDSLLINRKIDIAMWINLGRDAIGETGIDTVTKVSKGRVMTAIYDFTPHKGFNHKPEELAGLIKKGYVGFKIWYGPYYRVIKDGETGNKYVDDPANEPMFAAIDKAGILATSIHIADPNGPFGNRGNWAKDPVEFWREVIGMERVLQRHPNMKVIAAHCCWLICQDAQIDFLRYMLKTYPNFYVDLAATEQYYYLPNRENLRDFMVEYADRIMFGTDKGPITTSAIRSNVNSYARFFQILETEDEITGRNSMKGLNLPKDVLEKIYYKNAMKLYPGLSQRMASLGYKN
jgi:hypothetical protein